MTVDVLACALPAAGCPAPGTSTLETNLARITTIGAGGTRPISAARAAAYAHAVNLRAYDLPGSRQLAPEATGNDRRYWEAFARCSGAPRFTPAVATIHSPTFQYSGRGLHESVSSTVAVLRSEAIADRYVATVAGARALRCIAHAYIQALESPSSKHRRVNFGQITVRALPSAPPSTYRGSGPFRSSALGLAIQLNFTTRRGEHAHLPLYIEGATFASGRAVIELSTISIARPFPDASERYLMSALVGRAQAGGV
jgi:hypothetical protein